MGEESSVVRLIAIRETIWHVFLTIEETSNVLQYIGLIDPKSSRRVR